MQVLAHLAFAVTATKNHPGEFASDFTRRAIARAGAIWNIVLKPTSW